MRFTHGEPILAIMNDGTEIAATYEGERPPSLIKVRLENGMIQMLRREELEGIWRR